MPKEIKGNWKKGFALNYHTVSSSYLGKDDLGYDRYNTIRTEIGQLVYELKYRNNRSVITQIVEIIHGTFKNLNIMDYIIPVPPSKNRELQPVYIIAEALGEKLDIPVLKDKIIKIKETPQLKDISNPDIKEKVLKKAFRLKDNYIINNKNILLLDDLFDTGATLRAITSILYSNGHVKNVYVLTLTMTRS